MRGIGERAGFVARKTVVVEAGSSECRGWWVCGTMRRRKNVRVRKDGDALTRAASATRSPGPARAASAPAWVRPAWARPASRRA
jgi:hypothetical protein